MSMRAQLFKCLSVFPYALVAWIVVLFLLSLIIHLPRGFFIALHSLADFFVFGVVFHYYYEVHASAKPFETTAWVMFLLFLFEAILFTFFIPDMKNYLNFIDWIFPAFLIATTVYALKSLK